MVRLKDFVFPSIYFNLRISIPYGAIKSVSNVVRRTTIGKFQFLMVRLKEFV